MKYFRTYFNPTQLGAISLITWLDYRTALWRLTRAGAEKTRSSAAAEIARDAVDDDFSVARLKLSPC